ncbi:MAG TPA: isoprenylcysteine carboxylmethyltransferase family protein [Candidatus Limnocylindria bacterium]|jgi:protein-S-isoprenylcysteine O-methyltransferase Ste14|nr:isoprenylcysteine carboxylmethyltransferase family protein [Candidatus Limnocylindria bacterium]
MDDRAFRIGVLLAAHVIFLSAAALRITNGQRGHLLRSRAAWWLQYYPPLVWLPFVVAYAFPVGVELADGLQLAGVAIAVGSALFAAWAMWSLGRSYGIRMDLFEGHRLVTEGPYRVVRHPMYLGIVFFHIGAIFAMESLLLLAATALVVVPFTAARIVAEEGVLREGFGAKYAAFIERVPALVPFAR